MLEFVSGNPFDYQADIRVNTVNCVGVMGAGIALLFKQEFPEMYSEYVIMCKKNELKPGEPYVWHHSDMISKSTIINFPTKGHWKKPSEYEYIEKGLIWLKEYLSTKEGSTVALPALGCGYGGLDWYVVKGMITDYLGGLDLRILVFEPGSLSAKDPLFNDGCKEQGIFMLSPSDELYPPTLRGRSALEIYYKGNIELIKRKNISLLLNPALGTIERNALARVLDELPRNEFVFLLGLSNDEETSVAKEILARGFMAVLVVPNGILQYEFCKDIAPMLDYDKVAVLSASHPNQKLTKSESFNSFRLRKKLANVTLINSHDIENLVSTIKYIDKGSNTIFYISYWSKEVDALKTIPATGVWIKALTGTPNVLPLLEALHGYGLQSSVQDYKSERSDGAVLAPQGSPQSVGVIVAEPLIEYAHDVDQ